MAKRNIEELIVGPSDSIRHALIRINQGGIQIAFVVDGERRLVGSFTDGDWRRGLEAEVELGDPVSTVMNVAPVTLREGRPERQALALMRRRGVRQLPIVDEQGRLTDIVTMDELLAPGRQPSWIVIMAGGLGTRLRPFTHAVPKPMLPIGDRPLLEIMIEHLAGQGFGTFFLSVNYMPEAMEQHFGDGERLGVSIRYLIETRQLGTAGALALLPEAPTAPVMVMNGDLLTTLDAARLIQFHRDNGAPATICARNYARRIPYGVLKLDERERYAALEEKPLRVELVSAGINVLSPEALALIPSGEPCDMPGLMDSVRERLGAPAVYRMREYWLDIGQIEDLQQAQADVHNLFG
jgi:dTDP-glucose pyrophosphorylase